MYSWRWIDVAIVHFAFNPCCVDIHTGLIHCYSIAKNGMEKEYRRKKKDKEARGKILFRA